MKLNSILPTFALILMPFSQARSQDMQNMPGMQNPAEKTAGKTVQTTNEALRLPTRRYTSSTEFTDKSFDNQLSSVNPNEGKEIDIVMGNAAGCPMGYSGLFQRELVFKKIIEENLAEAAVVEPVLLTPDADPSERLKLSKDSNAKQLMRLFDAGKKLPALNSLGLTVGGQVMIIIQARNDMPVILMKGWSLSQTATAFETLKKAGVLKSDVSGVNLVKQMNAKLPKNLQLTGTSYVGCSIN